MPGPPEASFYLTNKASGIAHMVVETSVRDSAIHFITRCCWRTRSGPNVELLQSPPQLHKDLCECCFPELCGVRKRRLMQSFRAYIKVGEIASP